jgi:hypothetical protein
MTWTKAGDCAGTEGLCREDGVGEVTRALPGLSWTGRELPTGSHKSPEQDRGCGLAGWSLLGM